MLTIVRTATLVLLALPAQGMAQSPDSLMVEAPGRRIVLRAADLALLPRDTIRNRFHDDRWTVLAGVSLNRVLALAGVRTDSLRGRVVLSQRVVVEAADGFRIVFALAELDPTLGGHRVVLVDTEDGAPLPARFGPWQLAFAGEQRPSRWIRQVVRLRVLDEP